MTVTDTLRRAIAKSGETHYRIGKQTGVDIRNVDRFMSGESLASGHTIDRLADYFNLELVEKKQQKSAKKATKRR